MENKKLIGSILGILIAVAAAMGYINKDLVCGNPNPVVEQK